MVKKVVVALVVIVVVVLLASYYFMQPQSDSTSKRANKTPTNMVQEHTKPKIKTDAQLVQTIVQKAKEGSIPNRQIKVGKTTVTTISKRWGKGEKSDQIDGRFYRHYPKKKVVIGYQGSVIQVVRSFASDMRHINLDTIKKQQGKPDKTHFFNAEDTHQIILVYHVTDAIDLKWILPKPTEKVPNPSVDHISVELAQHSHATESNSGKGTNSGDNTNSDSKTNSGNKTNNGGKTNSGSKTDSGSTTNADTNTNKDTNNDSDEKANANTNTDLDIKIGQMIMGGVDGTTFTSEMGSLINKDHVGGIILYANNLETKAQSKKLIRQLKQANKGNQKGLLLGVDQEGGRVARLPGVAKVPTNQTIGTWNSPKRARNVGVKLAGQVKQFGFNLDFAPVLDVNSNPDNPVIGDRSLSSDPNEVARLGIPLMNGIKSKGIIPVVKHFPGHGDTSVDSHLQLPKVEKDLPALKKLELIPFKAAIKHDAPVVMVAHILLPKLDPNYPASMSKKIMNGLLRNQLGYHGVIMTDDLTMGAITNNYGIGKAAVRSIKGGSDIVLVAHGYDNVSTVFQAIKTAVKQGDISMEQINASVKRISRLKKNYGLD